MSWSPPPPPLTPGTVLSSQQAPHARTDPPADTPPTRGPAAIPHLSTSDRTAVAGATGVYLSPGGEITPSAVVPSWTTISRYVQERHRKVDAAVVAAAYNIPVGDGVSRIDLNA